MITDIGLPGSGLFIGYIDESIIKTKYNDFSINANPKKHGVDLNGPSLMDIGFQSIFPFNDPYSEYFKNLVQEVMENITDRILVIPDKVLNLVQIWGEEEYKFCCFESQNKNW